MHSSLRFLLVVWFFALLLAGRLGLASSSGPNRGESLFALNLPQPSAPVNADSIVGLDDVAQALGFLKHANTKGTGRVKIAILDNGFRGWLAEVGKSLPESTVYHDGPVAVDPKSEDPHGLVMAQILSGLLNKTQINYDLHLYSAFGYTNFSAAVNLLIQQKIDIVLYSQVWEYGGNGDGAGFINTLVNRALTRPAMSAFGCGR